MPKLRHYDDLGTVRFVTFSCYRRMPYLTSPLARQILVEQIGHIREKCAFKILGYVVMPEHVHLVLYPPEEIKLGYVIGEIKSFTARIYFARTKVAPSETTRVFWQKRCYDHNCRSISSVKEKIEYCHNNPVKRGLVERPEDWEWSSYNWYSGKRDVPLIIDEMIL